MALDNENDREVTIATHGDHTVSLADLLTELKYQTSWHLVGDAVKRLVIKSLFAEHSIESSEDEVLGYMDAYREERGLYTEEEISTWLGANNMDDTEFYELCEYEHNLELLKEKLFSEDDISRAFAFRKLDLDAVELYHIITDTEDLAEEILAVSQEGADFFSMAKKFSTEEDTKQSCGYMGVVTRADLRAEIEAAVFGAKKGEIVGPFKGTRGYHLYLIDDVIPADIENSRAELVEQMFKHFIERKLAETDIEYLAGQSS